MYIYIYIYIGPADCNHCNCNHNLSQHLCRSFTHVCTIDVAPMHLMRSETELTDGIGTPDPNPINVGNRCF